MKLKYLLNVMKLQQSLVADKIWKLEKLYPFSLAQNLIGEKLGSEKNNVTIFLSEICVGRS